MADFATSRILNSAGATVTESKPRGTPSYMPPEAFNERRMGLEGDIYAFGITAWEILSEQKGVSLFPHTFTSLPPHLHQ